MHSVRLLLLLRALAGVALWSLIAWSPALVHAAKAPGAEQFQQGRKLYKEGRFDQALPLFRQALAASGSPNARLYVARTLRELGNVTEAYREMKATLDDARAKAETDPKYVKTRDSAAAEIALLEPEVGKLVVVVAGAGDDVVLTVDGEPAEVGRPIVVSPGERVVVAKAPGQAPAEQQVTVAGGETATVALTFPQAPTGGSAPGGGTPSGGPPTVGDGADEPDPGSGGAVRIAGFVVAGLGVASMVVFGVTAAMAKSDFDTLNEECGGVRCTDPAYADTVDSGKAMELASHVTLGVGLAGMVAGGLMIAFGGPDESTETTADVAPLPGGGLLTVRGRF